MKTRVPLYAVCALLCLVLVPACSNKKKATATDEAAVTPTEQTAGEALDKDVISEDYAAPGEPLPSDADIPAASASLPGSSSAAAYPAQTGGSAGYPDYDTGSSRAHGGTASGGTYTVKSGDSLWTISRKNGTTVHALAAANGLTDKSVLRPGQKLVLSGGSSSKSASSSGTSAEGTYRVKRGDSYSTIARSHGTTVKKLKEVNNATSDALREGQLLKTR